MTGIIVYSDEKRAAEVREKMGHLCSFEPVPFRAFSPAMLENRDYIMADWNLKDELFDCLYGKTDLGIGFFHELFISDIDDIEALLKIEKQAREQHRWDICKGINSFLVYGDVIRKRLVLNGKPSKIQIETTDLCNARCIMCSHAYNRGTGTDILESGIIGRIEPILPYVRTIVLHGNGEPFLKKDLTGYLRQFSEYHISFITNTNLSIVNDEILHAMKSYFIELNVSCDAHEKELYEMIRAGLNFETFVENVKRVRAACPELVMKMNVVVMRQNLAHLSQIVRFAAELGFDEVIFNQLCVDAKNNNLEDDPYLYPELYVRNMEKAVQEAKRTGIVIRCPQLTALEPHTDHADRPRNEPVAQFRGICDWLVESPYINLQGDVAFCCMNQMKTLGNVFRDDIESIWNNSAYQKLREDFHNNRLNVWCQGCDFMLQNRLRYLKLLSSDSSSIRKRGRA